MTKRMTTLHLKRRWGKNLTVVRSFVLIQKNQKIKGCCEIGSRSAMGAEEIKLAPLTRDSNRIPSVSRPLLHSHDANFTKARFLNLCNLRAHANGSSNFTVKPYYAVSTSNRGNCPPRTRTRRAEMSAAVTPEMRPACPMVSGWMRESFSRASIVMDRMA